MFYTIRIQTKTDGTEVRNIVPFETSDEAEIRFHSCLAADMNNDDLKSVLVCVLTEQGVVTMSRYWVKEEGEE